MVFYKLQFREEIGFLMSQQMVFNVATNGFSMSQKNELFKRREEIGF